MECVCGGGGGERGGGSNCVKLHCAAREQFKTARAACQRSAFVKELNSARSCLTATFCRLGEHWTLHEPVQQNATSQSIKLFKKAFFHPVLEIVTDANRIVNWEYNYRNILTRNPWFWVFVLISVLDKACLGKGIVPLSGFSPTSAWKLAECMMSK